MNPTFSIISIDTITGCVRCFHNIHMRLYIRLIIIFILFKLEIFKQDLSFGY